MKGSAVYHAEDSYLHGWSPDGKRLISTGNRNKEYNIWSADVETKKETPLTEVIRLYGR